MPEFLRIVRDPEICGGQPTIKGTRVLVLDILSLLKVGLINRVSRHEFIGAIFKVPDEFPVP